MPKSHPREKHALLRSMYVFRRLSLEQAALHCGVTKVTARRWKNRAKDAGDDWDAARSAAALGDAHFKDLSRKLLEDYLVQHQATIDMLRADEGMDALKRATTLASLADSFGKTMAAFKRVTPELDKQAVQLDVLQRLADFVRERMPQHVGALVEILDAAGPALAADGGV